MERVGRAAASDADGLTRRDVIKRGGLLAIAISVPAAGTGHIGPAFAATSGSAGAAQAAGLTPGQTAVLEAIVERLVPPDANGPGGKEAGAAAFIERGLTHKSLGALLPLYTSGLAGVDAYAQQLFGGAFASLSPDQQDAVLTNVASGKATGFATDPAMFFATVREHTLEGMFSDPVYGGNKGFAGWNLIGYPGVRMPVPQGDQKVGVPVKPAHKSTYAGGQFAAAKKEVLA